MPLYDRGAFMPWKLLLKMGKIKPSPEAIDMFMSLGDRVADNVKRKLNDIITEDIFWGVITPSQAMLMLYGVAPPTPKETVPLMKEIFVEKEKLLEQKYVDILDRIVTLYKKYEHEEIKTISGKEIDSLVEQSSEYIKRLKELMKQIEERISEQEIDQIYDNVFSLLKNILGPVSESTVLARFDKELIKKAKLSPRTLTLLKDIVEIKKKYKKGKITKQDLGSARLASHELISALLEYIQRTELIQEHKHKIEFYYKVKEGGKELSKKGELFIFKDAVFIIPNVNEETIKKFSVDKLVNTDRAELKKYMAKGEMVQRRLTPELLNLLKKQFNEFELIF